MGVSDVSVGRPGVYETVVPGPGGGLDALQRGDVRTWR